MKTSWPEHRHWIHEEKSGQKKETREILDRPTVTWETRAQRLRSTLSHPAQRHAAAAAVWVLLTCRLSIAQLEKPWPHPSHKHLCCPNVPSVDCLLSVDAVDRRRLRPAFLLDAAGDVIAGGVIVRDSVTTLILCMGGFSLAGGVSELRLATESTTVGMLLAREGWLDWALDGVWAGWWLENVVVLGGIWLVDTGWALCWLAMWADGWLSVCSSGSCFCSDETDCWESDSWVEVEDWEARLSPEWCRRWSTKCYPPGESIYAKNF